MLYLKLCGFTALVVTCPVWLYQIWAFIMPGLHPSEKRWTRIFVAVAVPLFLVGVVLGWLTLPKGLEVLIGFNPDVITNLIDFNEYLQFFTRTLLVFGLAFEIPVFVVMLNRAGVVKGKTLGAVPALDHHRHLRLRRDRDAVDRPVHDDDHGRADGASSTASPRSSPASTTAARPSAAPTPACRPTRRRRCDRATSTSVDPFDLPEWLGVADVTWSAQAGLRTGYAVRGELHRRRPRPARRATCSRSTRPTRRRSPTDDVRLRAHQAWRHGEVHLVRRDGRLALAVPGTFFTADLVLDAFARLARAVGASADRYAVLLRIGDRP